MKKRILISSGLFLLASVAFFSLLFLMSNDDEKLRELYYDHVEEENIAKEILPQFEQLLEINPETIGWLKVPNTNIDYPVVKGDDNIFYLDHDFNQEPEIRGAIFMDYRNKGDGSDRHTIIYGHQSRLGVKFSELNKYRERDFFENNEIIYLTTLYEEQAWQVFAAYETSTSFYYIVTEFRSDASFLSTIEQFQTRSKFESDVTITKDDQILTLSTCVYGVDNMRFVVQAKRIK